MTETNQKRLFVIDTDAGIDDAQAIFMALAANDVTVLAITTVQGNTSSDQVAKNVLRVLKVANRLDIPVYKGCDRTILGRKSVDSGYHGSDGFGDCLDDEPPSEEIIKKEHALDVLIKLSCDYKDEITLVCLGPLSNIAAVLQRDPSFGKILHDMSQSDYQLVISRLRYNILIIHNFGWNHMSSEYNFHCDPEAASAVLENLKTPITLVGWELCEDNGFPWSWYEDFRKINSEKIKFVTRLENFAIQKHYLPRLEKGLAMNYEFADQILVACVINPSVVRESRIVYAAVETAGEITRGQVVIDWKNQLSKKQNVKIITKIDRDGVADILIRSLCN
ncbi:hypothetical protein KUTeg_021854 [Tegillarca granosa]|uniref:Inosine/uridine-preferring nucleoside hydrolase domain-containing protein n=1 Tax=Tegillarca granosa TaxID=220873 RepID=A0ABQ9E5D8_TEGGR|nr:hypothetical protein KUTeg_021854 [Tegillarca granosa]